MGNPCVYSRTFLKASSSAFTIIALRERIRYMMGLHPLGVSRTQHINGRVCTLLGVSRTQHINGRVCTLLGVSRTQHINGGVCILWESPAHNTLMAGSAPCWVSPAHNTLMAGSASSGSLPHTTLYWRGLHPLGVSRTQHIIGGVCILWESPAQNTLITAQECVQNAFLGSWTDAGDTSQFQP